MPITFTTESGISAGFWWAVAETAMWRRIFCGDSSDEMTFEMELIRSTPIGDSA
jgi:hypothetical protein